MEPAYTRHAAVQNNYNDNRECLIQCFPISFTHRGKLERLKIILSFRVECETNILLLPPSSNIMEIYRDWCWRSFIEKLFSCNQSADVLSTLPLDLITPQYHVFFFFFIVMYNAQSHKTCVTVMFSSHDLSVIRKTFWKLPYIVVSPPSGWSNNWIFETGRFFCENVHEGEQRFSDRKQSLQKEM